MASAVPAVLATTRLPGTAEPTMRPVVAAPVPQARTGPQGTGSGTSAAGAGGAGGSFATSENEDMGGGGGGAGWTGGGGGSASYCTTSDDQQSAGAGGGGSSWSAASTSPTFCIGDYHRGLDVRLGGQRGRAPVSAQDSRVWRMAAEATPTLASATPGAQGTSRSAPSPERLQQLRRSRLGRSQSTRARTISGTSITSSTATSYTESGSCHRRHHLQQHNRGLRWQFDVRWLISDHRVGDQLVRHE